MCATGFIGSRCEIRTLNVAYLSVDFSCDLIAIIALFVESISLCSDDNTTSVIPISLTTFGSGSTTYSSNTPASFNFTTNYTQKFVNPISAGCFGFTNVVPSNYASWHGGAIDHTPNDTNGYMFVVNADLTPSQFYKSTIDNLCIGQRYEFSVYLANVIKQVSFPTPNILFEIRNAAPDNTLVAQLSSGNIPEYSVMTWTKYGVSFIATNTSLVLLMISNTPSSVGNDLAIDDIAFSMCSNINSSTCLLG